MIIILIENQNTTASADVVLKTAATSLGAIVFKIGDFVYIF